ncbi:MAG: membrane protein insertase YidC [Kiritimatiellia bacterium]
MKRNDIIIVLVLILSVFLYPAFDRKFIAPLFPARPAPAAPVATPAETAKPVPAAAAAVNPETPAVPPAPAPATTNTAPRVEIPEQFVTLRNGLVELRLTNRGGAVASATFTNYTARVEPASGPLTWDFTEESSAAYQGLEGISADNGLELKAGTDGRTATFTGTTAGGLRFTREITLSEKNYFLTIRDSFQNAGAASAVLPRHQIRLGRIHQLDKVSEVMPTLGLDVSHEQGVGVKHYSRDVAKWARNAGAGEWHTEKIRIPADWAALKNKFFTQLLHVKEGDLSRIDAVNVRVLAKKDGKGADRVGADLLFESVNFAPGDGFTREMKLYVGPKKLTMLKEMGENFGEAMDFGLWRIFAWIPRVLLNLLNFFHDTLPPYNYGVAIILLTLLVRGLFWPLMNANSDQMRKMQALAPEIAALRAKYKNDFQKQNQAIMALYQAKGVNPMASLRGCFPLLLQIPVFFALFGVLRAAVELRYAKFLWIKDLSEPENLFAGSLPFSLNLLPLLMGVTMYLQQKLTPSTMDEMQKKIMQFFPLMFLFMFYSMPAGLLLYWTTSNLVSIYQLVHKTRKEKRREAAEAAAGGVTVLPPAAPASRKPPPGKNRPRK